MLESQQPHTSASAPVRGVHRLWDPRVWGTIVGATGATVFVLTNRGALAPPWPTLAIIAWLGALLPYVWCVFGAPRVFDQVGPVGSRAGITYVVSVVGMLVLIRLGTVLLHDANIGGLRPALIVVAVGLHFLPFAKAFKAPMFLLLGTLMAVLGTAGLVLGWVWDEWAAATSAVVTGLVMLLVIAGDARRPHGRRG
jgi:hypothetical protein